ncbi:hypothetical protein BDZ89DRAFT_457664 [Hymenopellis radicata]|nr:hypothetical protein BDZ89DRAFT_457664 [Hymenopellis radicata]
MMHPRRLCRMHIAHPSSTAHCGVHMTPDAPTTSLENLAAFDMAKIKEGGLLVDIDWRETLPRACSSSSSRNKSLTARYRSTRSRIA